MNNKAPVNCFLTFTGNDYFNHYLTIKLISMFIQLTGYKRGSGWAKT